MSRALFVWVAASLAAAGLAVVGTGCTMCQHPYDYSGPVVCGGHPEPAFVRAGSALSGMQPVPGSEVMVTGAASPAVAKGAEQTARPTERSLLVEEQPARIEGRKTDERLPEGWKTDSPATLPHGRSPLNGRAQ